MPRKLIPPLTNRVEDLPARQLQRLLHHAKAHLRRLRHGLEPAAVVILPVIHAPAGQRLCIALLIAPAPGPKAAGHDPTVAVQANLQTLGVDIVHKRLDAVGE